MVLSQPQRATTASKAWAITKSSIESAITSREMSEAFMPSVPMVMPSEIVMVSNSMGVPAGGADAFLHFFRERAQMEIAGRHFRPGIGDGHQRAREIGVGEAGGLQHGAGGRPGNSFFYFVTVHVLGPRCFFWRIRTNTFHRRCWTSGQ